jgi:hypothetical protein
VIVRVATVAQGGGRAGTSPPTATAAGPPWPDPVPALAPAGRAPHGTEVSSSGEVGRARPGGGVRRRHLAGRPGRLPRSDAGDGPPTAMPRVTRSAVVRVPFAVDLVAGSRPALSAAAARTRPRRGRRPGSAAAARGPSTPGAGSAAPRRAAVWRRPDPASPGPPRSPSARSPRPACAASGRPRRRPRPRRRAPQGRAPHPRRALSGVPRGARCGVLSRGPPEKKGRSSLWLW